jgi:hypothetical protein
MATSWRDNEPHDSNPSSGDGSPTAAPRRQRLQVSITPSYRHQKIIVLQLFLMILSVVGVEYSIQSYSSMKTFVCCKLFFPHFFGTAADDEAIVHQSPEMSLVLICIF